MIRAFDVRAGQTVFTIVSEGGILRVEQDGNTLWESSKAQVHTDDVGKEEIPECVSESVPASKVKRAIKRLRAKPSKDSA